MKRLRVLLLVVVALLLACGEPGPVAPAMAELPTKRDCLHRMGSVRMMFDCLPVMEEVAAARQKGPLNEREATAASTPIICIRQDNPCRPR